MIFISYRHDGDKDATDRIYAQLRDTFGAANVVRDIDTMPLGTNWRDFVQQRIHECRVVLAIVGPKWTDLRSDDGVNRLEKLNDPIRLELETALNLNRCVIPVAVSGAPFPKESELPGPLKPMESLIGLSVRPDPDFRNDILRLIDALRAHVDGSPTSPTPPSPYAPHGTPTAPSKLHPTFAESVRNFIERFRRSYQPYEPKHAALADPREVFVPLNCLPQHDMSAASTDVIAWLREGIGELKAQLVLSDYGMGKSFLALELQRGLAEEFFADPEHQRVPIVFPLKYHRRRTRPDGIIDDLADFLRQHDFPITSRDDLTALLAAGRLCLILDGVDEIPLIQTVDPRMTPQILERLDLRRYGPCPWVATSRTGLFAAALPDLREQRPYRLAFLLNWGQGQWRSYVYRIDDRLRLFQNGDAREAFLQTIEGSPRLNELTATPLLARMLVESWASIQSNPNHLNLIGLYRHYTDYILAAKQDESVMPDLDARRQCLESAAVRFFQNSVLACSSDELLKIADEYISNIARPDIATFVRIELQTYSLLVCDPSTGTLGFSHKSFYEYFLASAFLRELRTCGFARSHLMRNKRLDPGEAGFIAAQLAELDNQPLRNEMQQLLHADNSLYPAPFRRNLVLVATLTTRAANQSLSAGDSPFAPLAGAMLAEVELSGLNLSDCDFSGANLSGVAAVGVNFTGAKLARCTMTSANLTGCDFSGADLRDANLEFCTIASIEQSSRPPRVAGCKLRGISIWRRDAAYVNYLVDCDLDGDDTWRTKTKKAINKGVIDNGPAPSAN